MFRRMCKQCFNRREKEEGRCNMILPACLYGPDMLFGIEFFYPHVPDGLFIKDCFSGWLIAFWLRTMKEDDCAVTINPAILPFE